MNDLKDVFDYDTITGNFYWKIRASHRNKIGDLAGSVDNYGYRILFYKTKRIKAHRLAWYFHYGSWPSKTIDHINRNPSDNRIENLREATMRVQNQNRSNFKNGIVLKPSGAYQARIWMNKKSKHLGSFSSKEEAERAYKDAASVLEVS